ncbi:hypothetical protein ACWIUD_04900 [Helicobacter sp. 23-1044]
MKLSLQSVDFNAFKLKIIFNQSRFCDFDAISQNLPINPSLRVSEANAAIYKSKLN